MKFTKNMKHVLVGTSIVLFMCFAYYIWIILPVKREDAARQEQIRLEQDYQEYIECFQPDLVQQESVRRAEEEARKYYEQNKKLYEKIRLKNLVHDSHEKMNELVGWDGDKEFNTPNLVHWEQFNEIDYPNLYEKIKAARNGFSKETVKNDLNKALKSLELAKVGNNVSDLIQVHRILHDLDCFYFNQTSGKIRWGVTETVR